METHKIKGNFASITVARIDFSTFVKNDLKEDQHFFLFPGQIKVRGSGSRFNLILYPGEGLCWMWNGHIRKNTERID